MRFFQDWWDTFRGARLALLCFVVSNSFVIARLLAQESAKYHRYTIVQIAAANPADWKNLALSHVEVSGWVTYRKHEADGDWHLRVCDTKTATAMDKKHCIVAEIVPQIAIAAPEEGAHIDVSGIYRYDAENPGHHWAEIHPVEKLERLP